MAAKKKPEERRGGSAPDYLASFADLVTLLFAFFVLLFAMSSIDEERFTAMAAAFSSMTFVPTQGTSPEVFDLYGNGVMHMPTIAQVRNANSNQRATGTTDDDRSQRAAEELAQMESDFRTYFAENSLTDEQINVEIEGIHLVITLPNNILFASGQAQLNPGAMDVLSIVANALQMYPDNEIEIEGHTDTVPINTPQFPNNWFLSTARALSVLQYLVYERGFDPTRPIALGRGEYIPVATNDTEEGRAANRRVEIRVRSLEYSIQNISL
ncbi:MAG: flagellar motor protein MotB [Defluviitaleaceae bacterium]|nr:flagellar motor protein MotB [Defluviitaleaceae bacterium]